VARDEDAEIAQSQHREPRTDRVRHPVLPRTLSRCGSDPG
jgi:hypothetical protein